MAEKKISYNKRSFDGIREELIDFIKIYYPEILKDFTDSGVGSLLIDLNAAVADNLGVNIDRAFQETQLKYAQQKSSILSIAENMGLKIPNKRPSVTVVDFTFSSIPVKGDKPDSDYLPVILPGTQVVGGGNVFETEDIIDFNSPYSALGDNNRSIVPNLDSNGKIESYTITKREVVKNGKSVVYKKIIRSRDVKPFYELILPDNNIIEITSIILLDGDNYDGEPSDSDFNNIEYRYHEVDYLAQQKVFIDDPSNSATANIKSGIWIDTTKKFIKEFTANGSCLITFGSGDIYTDPFKTSFRSVGVENSSLIDGFLKNTALGEMLKPNNTLFIKYRVGGGSSSNIPANTISSLGNTNIIVSGSRQDFNNNVKRSLKVNNPIASYGGNDGLSIDEVRYLTKYNFSSQNRDVTINDYLLQIYKMPGRYGSPFRVRAFRENNKIVLPVLGLDSNGKLSNQSNTILKENIAEYLYGHRMVNDYIEVRDGKIINLACDIEAYVDNGIQTTIASNIIAAISSFFDVKQRMMNQDIHIGELIKSLSEVDGVINIMNVKFYNRIGDAYSSNVTNQELVSTDTGEIKLINNTLYCPDDGMFEIKYPERDIRLYLRKLNTI